MHKITILVHEMKIIFLKKYFIFSIHSYFIHSTCLHNSPLLFSLYSNVLDIMIQTFTFLKHFRALLGDTHLVHFINHDHYIVLFPHWHVKLVTQLQLKVFLQGLRFSYKYICMYLCIYYRYQCLNQVWWVRVESTRWHYI